MADWYRWFLIAMKVLAAVDLAVGIVVMFCPALFV